MAATTPRTGSRWEILVRCGDPSIAAVGATFSSATTQDGWFGMPDNCAVDAQGRLWVATDGNSAARTGRADGIWAMETEGRGARHVEALLPGAGRRRDVRALLHARRHDLFLAVQHPGEADEDDPNAKPATFENPSTRWPDFDAAMPPRPSVVAITRRGGGRVGT